MERQPGPRLRGKVAVVSGAGTHGGAGVGNGSAAAILFARAGARVALVDAVPEWADATRDMIAAEGGEAFSIVADSTNASECESAIAAAVERYGAIHVLHNNVGGGRNASVVDAADDDWEVSAAVNLKSAVHMSRYAIPHMRTAGGGSITHVSSVTALRPKAAASSAPYTVYKAALMGLTAAMALDHAAENIRVNCIMPGLMWTPRVEQGRPDHREMRRSSTPLPVEGEGWDIGWAALYLASDESRFVTGIVLPVDGGFLLTSAPN